MDAIVGLFTVIFLKQEKNEMNKKDVRMDKKEDKSKTDPYTHV